VLFRSINFLIKPIPGDAGAARGVSGTGGAYGVSSGPEARQRPLYLYIQSRQIDYTRYIKGNNSEGHDIQYYPYIIDTQYFGDTDGDIEISLKIEESVSGSVEIHAAYFDEEAFAEAYEILNSRPLQIDSFRNTKFTGTIRADRLGVLFTTVPYDRGWSVKLDGVKLKPGDIERVGEGFIAVNIGAGTHKVEFSFMPEGFVLGLIVSLLSIAVLCAIIMRAEASYEKN
jgi:uncharacterized membrane protein YfhO